MSLFPGNGGSDGAQETTDKIPATLSRRGALRLRLAVLLTGKGSGVAAAALTRLLQFVQHLAWPGVDLLDAAARAGTWRHIWMLLAAGLLTGAGQIILHRLTGGNEIAITEAMSRFGGRLPALRTLGSAVLSVVLVGMGASLGREGAPKQAGAVIANVLSDGTRLSDEQRKLLVACGAGAGMAAAYGVPLRGALFAVEVLRGVLALRLVLPALLAAAMATAVSWLALPNAPTYVIPAYGTTPSVAIWAALAGPIAGLVSVGYVRTIAWADFNKLKGWQRLLAPILALGLLGVVSIEFTGAWELQRQLTVGVYQSRSTDSAADPASPEACYLQSCAWAAASLEAYLRRR